MINENEINQLLANEITKAVKQKMLHVDIPHLVSEATTRELADKITHIKFPEGSIPFDSIRNNTVTISGNQVNGGIHKKFKSRGIEDHAIDCELSVLDDNVVVENTLVARNANIKENLIVDGNLIVHGTIPADCNFFIDIVEGVIGRLGEEFDKVFKQSIVDGVLFTLKNQGIDVSKISLNGNVFTDGTSIAGTVTTSNLQKVGQLKELQVKGESFLADTLYVTKGRIGINTVEPSASLSVWDEETEVVIKKHSRHKAYIGSSRDTTVVLGANRNDNIVLNQDGSASIDNLKIGGNKFTSNPILPNVESVKGHIVFNSHPDIGRPVGWVCLGGNRWSSFGNCE
jgi:hypothetical protein